MPLNAPVGFYGQLDNAGQRAYYFGPRMPGLLKTESGEQRLGHESLSPHRTELLDISYPK